MKNLREILTSFNEEDYKNNEIDLHIHTKCSDGLGDSNQILESAKKKNYKLISITDHNTVEAHKNISDDILITGVEFDCWYKYIFLHLLAYGIDIDNEDLKPFLAKSKKDTEAVLPRLFAKRNLKKLIEAIHKANGVAILAHPACCWALNPEQFIKDLIEIGLDGIEIYYPYPRFRKIAKFHDEKKFLNIANKYPKLIKTGGTDFHEKTF